MYRLALVFASLITVFGSLNNKALGQTTKKVVFIAGTKSHGPGDHEYEKGLRLLADSLEYSKISTRFKTEVHLYGWPANEKTLDDADTIVVYCDGSDHKETDHPLLVGDRLKTLDRQMKRGCGLVLLHYATFAGIKHGGPEYLKWVGGHYDYETGPGANHWASAIQFATAKLELPTPSHPISNGLQSLDLKDEYYYKMKFDKVSTKWSPIINVRLPNEPEIQTVGWAVERPDGGRGFAFTGGHPYINFRNDNFRKMMLNAIAWTAKTDIPARGINSQVSEGIDNIRVMIVTGKHHPAHDWKATTQVLLKELAKDPRIKCEVIEDPEKLSTTNLSPFHAILFNYCNWESSTLSNTARNSIMQFADQGKGFMLLHFANGAWRDWPDYFGKLARRVWVDGKANHDPYGSFHVEVHESTNRLMQGLTDFDSTDELYCSQVGDLPVIPLLTAKSKTTGKEEPLAFTYEFRKAKVFQTLLGHDANAVNTPTHAELLRRAIAWVSNREILPLPFEASTSAPVRSLVGVKTATYSPPITVEALIKVRSASGFNIIAANHDKSSPSHWEIYTAAGSGNLSCYLPGYKPDIIESNARLMDNHWHLVTFQWQQNSARLYVDGRLVKDQNIVPDGRTDKTKGKFWIGSYPPQGLGFDGQIDEIRISNFIRDIKSLPTSPMPVDRETIGLWRIHSEIKDRYVDESPLNNHVTVSTGSNPAPKQSRYDLVAANPPLPLIKGSTDVDWANVGNDKGAVRYSPLTQINKSNLSRLEKVWEYHAGDHNPKGNSTIECTPVVVDGTMFITTPGVNVVALDPQTGKQLWRFNPHAGGVNRGIAYWSDGKLNGERRVLVSFTDGFLYSLDARTGKPAAEFGENGILDLRKGLDRDISRFGYGASSAPSVYQNLVILGFISSEVGPGAPGDIRAFDVRTGKQVWQFHTVPRPGEFGYETWPIDAWKDRGGVNAWSGLTIDEKNGIVFAGLGSAASDFYGKDRIGDDLFANCTIALDIKTGKRLWHYQEVHHDLWDHDNPCPPTVVTLKRGKKEIDAVAQPTKTGYIFLFDRLTGKPLFKVNEKPVPPSDVPGEVAAKTQPVPVAPPPITKTVFTEADVTDRTPEAKQFVLEKLKKLRFGSDFLPPSLQGSVITPGFHGGATWSGASYDPTTNLLYLNTNNVPYVSTMVPDAAYGYNFTGYNYFRDQEGFPAVKPPWGYLTAVNLVTGKFAWQIPFGDYPALMAKGFKNLGCENFGGTIVTAGGLVIIGATADEKLHIFDKSNGKLLWETKLPAGGYATPATYMINGRQYIVIAAGGGGKIGTSPGDSFVAFAVRSEK